MTALLPLVPYVAVASGIIDFAQTLKSAQKWKENRLQERYFSAAYLVNEFVLSASKTLFFAFNLNSISTLHQLVPIKEIIGSEGLSVGLGIHMLAAQGNPHWEGLAYLRLIPVLRRLCLIAFKNFVTPPVLVITAAIEIGAKLYTLKHS